MAKSGSCTAPPGARIPHETCRYEPCSCWCHLDPCPECAAGKCRNCNGQTWDHKRDELGVCPCWAKHEKESA